MHYKTVITPWTPLVVVVSYLLLLSNHNEILAQNQPLPLLDDPSNIFINESSSNFETLISGDSSKCQTMNIEFCKTVGYNRTFLPNFLHHQTQTDVVNEINIYHPLVVNKCSPNSRLFICTVYAPICFDHDNGSGFQLYPCQSLCESVQQGCAAYLKKLGREWPEALRCDRFPDGRDKTKLCVGNHSQSAIDGYERENSKNLTERGLGFICPKNFEVNSYTLHLNGKSYNNCAMPCEDVYLDQNNARIVRLLAGVLSIIGLISTLFTCTTFVIDSKRFKYPARPIIIIAFCQLIVAACYLIGYLSENKIACNDPIDPPKALPNLRMIRTTTMGNKKGSCTLQFMALYFFQMSTMLWWLMMTISWYMVAKLKWAPESVSGIARYFHLFSWTIPALLTIYISVLGDIEGDSLTGTCIVGYSNRDSVNAFIIFPSCACLIAGCIFLMLGFKSIWDNREILRSEFGKQTDEHYKLVVRIGLFSFLVIMSSMVFIYTHHIEQANQSTWKLAWLSRICQNRDYSIPCPARDFSDQGPHYSVFILKYISTMAIGIISAIFTLSKKTISAYREMVEFVNYKLGV